jgi:imidazoleglycerol-phosphate dehydratase
MLDLFAKHGLFDLEVICKGDLEIDDHHSVEDIAITLGQALVEALGDKVGIKRYGEATVPIRGSLPLGNRSLRALLPGIRGGHPPAEDWKLFRSSWQSISGARLRRRQSSTCTSTVCVDVTRITFWKALSRQQRALREAVARAPRIAGVLSTKGSL